MKSKKILTKLLLLISITLITLIVAFWIKNKNKLIKSTITNLTKTGIDISIDNIHLIEEEEGKTQWELNADKAEVIHSNKTTRLKNVRMRLFQKNNTHVSVSADKGIIHNDSENVELEGNIQVYSGEGHVLTTNILKWVSEQKTFETTDDVKINGNNFILTGKRMKVNVDTEILELYGGVEAFFSDINTIMY